MTQPSTFARLTELGKKLPPFLESDWMNTNHYELTTPRERDYWWLILRDPDLDCNTEEGRRVGLLMDIAAEVRSLIDAGIFK